MALASFLSFPISQGTRHFQFFFPFSLHVLYVVIHWNFDCRHGKYCTLRGSPSWDLEQPLLTLFWKPLCIFNHLRLGTIWKLLKPFMLQGLVLKTFKGSCLNLKSMSFLTCLLCIIAWQSLGFGYSILFHPLLFFICFIV